MEKQMKTCLALAFAITLPNLVYAEVPCKASSSDIFKFMKGDLKAVDPHTTKVITRNFMTRSHVDVAAAATVLKSVLI